MRHLMDQNSGLLKSSLETTGHAILILILQRPVQRTKRNLTRRANLVRNGLFRVLCAKIKTACRARGLEFLAKNNVELNLAYLVVVG